MNFSKSFIHYSKVFQSGPTNEANVLIEIKYDVGKTTAEPPRRRRAAHNPNEPKGRAAAVKRTIVWRSPPNRSFDKKVNKTKELQDRE